jgi:hypothetical protein
MQGTKACFHGREKDPSARGETLSLEIGSAGIAILFIVDLAIHTIS